ncbi:MAG: FUSC family protein [Solirubrobacteraceae bacterium]
MGSERSTVQVRERGIALLEEAAGQSRPPIVAQRLATNARWVVQAAVATALAWEAAIVLFGHPRPIFAPVAALIGVSTALGQRRRYAVETILGIAVGVGMADALFVVIGGGTFQIAAIVAGAMVAALALGGSVVLVSEAAVSALLVVTIQSPSSGLSGARFLDSLLGGLIALAVTSLLPRNPVRAARRAAALPLAQIAATLEDIAQALDRADPDLAERALVRARAVDRDAFEQAVAAGRETLQLAPFARATRVQFARYVRAQTQVDTAITSVETLSRAVVRALAFGDNVPAPMPEAIRDLSSAVRRLEESLDDPSGEISVREPALRAAAQATLVLEQTGNLSANAIVVQVRAAAVDLLRGSGVTREESERLVREAAARWPELDS